MTTWITRLDAPGRGPRVAIKDLIDVAGVPTTAGSPAVAAVATPATSDAACMAGLREADAAIVGKANLHELAFGGTGVNRWFGTPRNPLDHRRIPGGSSSGSAVAVATGEADIALGTDTAGSIRTPSACCGTVGLKTTHGRILVGGVRALAPSLDVVGPMARDVAGVVAGMRLLDPGFSMDGAAPAPVIGRVRISGVDPRIDQALDDVLRLSEVEVLDLELPGFSRAAAAGVTVLLAEAWTVNRRLHDDHPDRLGPDVLQRLEHGCRITGADLDRARTVRSAWRHELDAAWDRAPVLVWPTLREPPPALDGATPDTRTTNVPVNLAGCPALALPVPCSAGFPASLQLVGSHGDEAVLCATGFLLEAAATSA